MVQGELPMEQARLDLHGTTGNPLLQDLYGFQDFTVFPASRKNVYLCRA